MRSGPSECPAVSRTGFCAQSDKCRGFVVAKSRLLLKFIDCRARNPLRSRGLAQAVVRDRGVQVVVTIGVVSNGTTNGVQLECREG